MSMGDDLPGMNDELPSMTEAQSTGYEPTVGRAVRRMLVAGVIAASAGGISVPATAGDNISPSPLLQGQSIQPTKAWWGWWWPFFYGYYGYW
jgi:hypothetical protein